MTVVGGSPRGLQHVVVSPRPRIRVVTSARADGLRNLALAAASTIVFAGLVEGVARLIEPPPVQKQEYLWDWKERFRGGDFYTLEKGEGYPPSEENNVDGLRDATRPVDTRPGLRRIVVLGDSVTFGHGLEAAQAFPQQLEARLRAAGRDVEVFNVALPGWSTRQERLAYERIARPYRPNAVVLAVCLNDLAELQINLAKPPGLLLSLFKYSATVRVALGASRREIGAVEELFTESASGRVENAWRLFFDEVRALEADVAKDGAQLSVVVFPFRFQVEPKAPAPIVQKRMADFAAAEGIPLLDYLPEMARGTNPADLFLDYDHFNATGTGRIALWLASRPEIVGEAGAASPSADAAREWAIHAIETRAAAVTDGRLPAELVAQRPTLVAEAVDAPSPRVRFAAARAVFALGLPGAESVETLVRGLAHDDPRVRAFATWTLGEMREIARPAMPALVALARKDGGAGKTGALTAIGKIGGDSPEAIPLLLQDLKHPKEARRYRAARTIGRMGAAGAPAIPGLIEALKDPSSTVRITAIKALADIGEAAKSAVPALVDVVNKDADQEVRKEASLALSKLPGR
jgi:lysophospholipase L1-like esterase